MDEQVKKPESRGRVRPQQLDVLFSDLQLFLHVPFRFLAFFFTFLADLPFPFTFVSTTLFPTNASRIHFPPLFTHRYLAPLIGISIDQLE